MTIEEVLEDVYKDILEEKHWNENGHKNNERDRYWDKSYISSNGRKGIWRYKHRDLVGAEPGDGNIIHHKDRNINNNDKLNLEKTTRAEHLKIDPLNKKYDDASKCKVKGCKKRPFAKNLCIAHYMKKRRAEQKNS